MNPLSSAAVKGPATIAVNLWIHLFCCLQVGMEAPNSAWSGLLSDCCCDAFEQNQGQGCRSRQRRMHVQVDGPWWKEKNVVINWTKPKQVQKHADRRASVYRGSTFFCYFNTEHCDSDITLNTFACLLCACVGFAVFPSRSPNVLCFIALQCMQLPQRLFAKHLIRVKSILRSSFPIQIIPYPLHLLWFGFWNPIIAYL